MKKIALGLLMLGLVAGCELPTYRVRLFSGDKVVGEWPARSYSQNEGLTTFTDIATGQRIAVSGNVIVDQYDKVIIDEKP